MPAPVYLKTPYSKKPGRPCLLTKKCEAKLLSAIEDGMPLKQAAMLAGVSYDSMNRWRKRGENEHAPFEFRHFCKAVERSQAVAMQESVLCIRKAAKHDWRAAAWQLERRHAEEFGKPQQVEHSGPGGAPIFPDPPLDHEVLQRMRKQTAVVDFAKKFGAYILARSEEEKKQGGSKISASSGFHAS